MIGLGTRAPHPRVAEGDLVSDAEGVVARGQVVQAEHAAEAEQAAAHEGPLEREDQIRIVAGDVVVDADPEAERPQHAERAHAAVDVAAASAHVAFARDADRGDRRRDRLEQADVQRSPRRRRRSPKAGTRRPRGRHRERSAAAAPWIRSRRPRPAGARCRPRRAPPHSGGRRATIRPPARGRPERAWWERSKRSLAWSACARVLSMESRSRNSDME